MADKVTKNMRDGILKLLDGTSPTPKEFEFIFEEGDLEFTEVQNVTNILDRGKLSHFREGDDEPVGISFTLKYVELLSQTSDPGPSFREALKHIGKASSWTSTSADSCTDIITNTLQFDVKSPCPGEESERMTFRKFYHTNLNFSEGDEFNTVAVEGVAYVKEADVTKVTL